MFLLNKEPEFPFGWKHAKSVDAFLGLLAAEGVPVYDFGGGNLIAPLPEGKIKGVSLYIIGFEETTNAGSTAGSDTANTRG